MNDKFEMSTGQAHEVAMAFGRNDWTNEEIKALCKGTTLADVRRVLLGHAVITVPEHVIDCDADPFNPWAKEGWVIDEQKGGQYKWDALNPPLLYLDEKEQRGGKSIEGKKLRKKLAKDLVKGALLNANVLDYLLKYPHLIPEEWKKDEKGQTRYIFFWGTVYRYSDGDLCVRDLYWDGGRWLWSSRWLDDDWNDNNPAALRAS